MDARQASMLAQPVVQIILFANKRFRLTVTNMPKKYNQLESWKRLVVGLRSTGSGITTWSWLSSKRKKHKGTEDGACNTVKKLKLSWKEVLYVAISRWSIWPMTNNKCNVKARAISHLKRHVY